MNRETLYLEIGNIDDDLILEASAACGRRSFRGGTLRLAACLCLICTAILWGMHREIIRYNEAPTPVTAKNVTPSDETTSILTLTYEELFEHYGMEPLPDTLAGLVRQERAHYFVCRSADGTVCDTNVITYCAEDRSQTVTILVSTEDSPKTDLKWSRISGIRLVLGVDTSTAQPIYWAELSEGGVFLRVVSSGMEEAAFTGALRELLTQ